MDMCSRHGGWFAMARLCFMRVYFIYTFFCIFLQQYRIHMDIGNSNNYLGISAIITIT